tara:strand:- start:551 stop:922 length:372 start_codon:yes stop_codon:yes gene_type:complete
MAVSYKSSGASSVFSVQCVDVTDIENTGLNDFLAKTTTVYSIDVDNIGSGVAYVKIYDSKAPTYGTTDPDIMLRVSATTHNIWTVAQGVPFSSGISMMASQADGPDAAAAPAGTGTNVSFVLT